MNTIRMPRERCARVSVLIPCRDERHNIAALIAEIDAALAALDREIIVVDDGSGDGTSEAVRAEAARRRGVRLIRHDRSAGQSAAIRSGLQAADGDIVVTIDGDGQNDPAYIPPLLDALMTGGEGIGMAVGQRVGRKTTWGKRVGSRIANAVRRLLLRDATRDTGCGLKAIRRHVFLRLPYFDTWHRFLPALVLREGFEVVSVDVRDRPRRHGTSKYGILDRLWAGLLDMFGVWWLKRRRRVRPVAHEETLDG